MEEQWIPGSKKEFMSAIEREFRLLLQVVENLTDAQMTKPDPGGWSPKDNLAHLTEWMNILIGVHLDKRPAHEVLKVAESVAESWDMEIINPVLFERNKDRSIKEVMDDLKQVYEQVLARLDAMSFEDLLTPRHAEDPEKRPILLWILGDTTEHFLEHRETIERGIKAG